MNRDFTFVVRKLAGVSPNNTSLIEHIKTTPPFSGPRRGPRRPSLVVALENFKEAFVGRFEVEKGVIVFKVDDDLF